MSHPDDELLAAVALGESPDADVAAHLATCPTCRAVAAELSDVLVAARADIALLEPPARVWDGVRSQLVATAGNGLPAAGPGPGVSRRQLFGWVAAAAASGVAVGAAGATWLATRPGASASVARVDLTTLDTRQVLGDADVRDTPQGVALAVRTQPLDARDGYLEVWLINRDLTRMVSVGVLPADRTEHSFPIGRRLLDEGYVVVDISREAFDDRPEHSGDSIVRGELPL